MNKLTVVEPIAARKESTLVQPSPTQSATTPPETMSKTEASDPLSETTESIETVVPTKKDEPGTATTTAQPEAASEPSKKNIYTNPFYGLEEQNKPDPTPVTNVEPKKSFFGGRLSSAATWARRHPVWASTIGTFSILTLTGIWFAYQASARDKTWLNNLRKRFFSFPR
jgi:hypothetical protein